MLHVAILLLDGAEVESLKESNHKLLLLNIVDVKGAEHLISGCYVLVHASVNVLNRHEILLDVLQEVVVQELESDAECLFVGVLHVLGTVSNGSLHDLELLWVHVLQTTIGSHHSV